VRLPRRGLPPVALAAIAIIIAIILFVVLNERRISQQQPPVQAPAPGVGAVAWQSPPPLYVPPQVMPDTAPTTTKQQQRPLPQPAPAIARAPHAPAVQTVYVPQPMPMSAPPMTAPQARVSSGSPLVIDTGRSASGAAPGVGSSSPSASATGVTRMRASAFANRSMTVPQGTMIQAVLETGFNSTQPGFARAVVSRDVRSFDGTNVLIPRGSKLIGEYRSDVAQGQKRALISWTRLIRPDGMTIAMDSPAVDTVGRGGVPASVNTHFMARLGDALLQSTIGIGSALAQRRVTGPVVVLPGNSTGAATQLAPASSSYTPTLTVRAGKSISVFVAHDLDFSAAGLNG
jgi:type IV secretion system protein VirB10